MNIAEWPQSVCEPAYCLVIDMPLPVGLGQVLDQQCVASVDL